MYNNNSIYCFFFFVGLCVESQESRYQFENKKLALQKLKILLSDLEQKKVRAEKISLKKEQVCCSKFYFIVKITFLLKFSTNFNN